MGAYFAVMILIGIIVMSRNRKASHFLVAGRKLNLLFTVATLRQSREVQE